MALVLETGVGVAGANSYVDPAGALAVAYFDAHLHDAAWVAASSPTRESVVQQATRMIDAAYSWLGTRKSTTQGLAWPRVGVYLDGALQDGLVPRPLAYAVLEQALALLAGDRTGVVPTPSGAVKSIGLGDGAVELDFEASPSATNDLGFLVDYVKILLRDLGTPVDRRSGMVPVRRA